MKTAKLFKRDFTMVVIGQIISLFGNAVLRFALPLYLLNQTHSSALFGLVSACSFIPMILLSPIGGIMADRVNKRSIMVILDFATAGLTVAYALGLGKIDLTLLTLVTLVLLYGIQGAYSPAVQASIPALAAPEQLVPANSAINMVSSLSGLIGPVIGGAVYAFYGIVPVLCGSALCFAASAVMEIFIHIPFEPKAGEGGVFQIAAGDMRDSLRFIREKQPVVMKVGVLTAAINLVFSALIIIGMPVIITEKLGFSAEVGNRLYGYCQGVMAAGGLLGGVLSGTLARRLSVKTSYRWLLGGCLTLLPIGLALLFKLPAMETYLIITLSCFVMMAASTVFSIQMLAYIQLITPAELIGKIMALAMCVCMCASPLGQAAYGWLFERLTDRLYLIFFCAMALSGVMAAASKRILGGLNATFTTQSANEARGAVNSASAEAEA